MVREHNSHDGSDSISEPPSEKAGLDGKIPGALLDKAEFVTAKGNNVTKDGVVISTQDSDASLSTNVFADPEIRAYFVDVYEKSHYEC